MTFTQSISSDRLFIADGGWGEGNDGSGDIQNGNGISIGIVPLTKEKEPDPHGLDGDFVRIYPVGNGFKSFAKIVIAIQNGCGELPIHFEPNGPLYPGCKGTKHSDFDPDTRHLNIQTDDALRDKGMLTVSAQTDYLHRDRYTLTIIDGRTHGILKEVELIRNTAIE